MKYIYADRYLYCDKSKGVGGICERARIYKAKGKKTFGIWLNVKRAIYCGYTLRINIHRTPVGC